jgi:hypothetical protein
MKKIILFVFCLAAMGFVYAQEEEETAEKKFDPSKLFFGGYIGLSFGDYTLVNVSPQVGYRFNQYFAAGAGINFIYTSTRYRYYVPEYKEEYGVAGLNIFGRIYPIQFLFLQLQPELNYTWGRNKYYDDSPEQKLKGLVVPSVLGGLGAAIPTGARGATIITAQYDLLQQYRSPYGNQVFFSFGYSVGF